MCVCVEGEVINRTANTCIARSFQILTHGTAGNDMETKKKLCEKSFKTSKYYHGEVLWLSGKVSGWYAEDSRFSISTMDAHLIYLKK